jgi:hypothetical protein
MPGETIVVPGTKRVGSARKVEREPPATRPALVRPGAQPAGTGGGTSGFSTL